MSCMFSWHIFFKSDVDSMRISRAYFFIYFAIRVNVNAHTFSAFIVCMARSTPSLYLPLPLFLNRMSYSNQKLIQCFYQFTTRMTFHSVRFFFLRLSSGGTKYKSIPTLIIWHLVCLFFFSFLFCSFAALFRLQSAHICFHSLYHYFLFLSGRVHLLYIFTTQYIWYILFSIFLRRSIGFAMPR